MELSPELRALRDFYYKSGLKLAPERDFVRGEKVLDKPSFFTLEHLRRHLNNPLLTPDFFKLYWQGKPVDCSRAMGHKVVQGAELPFLNKGIIEEYLANGAAVVLEAIDLFEPMVNAMCAAIDNAGEILLSNSVAFLSQQAARPIAAMSIPPTFWWCNLPGARSGTCTSARKPAGST